MGLGWCWPMGLGWCRSMGLWWFGPMGLGWCGPMGLGWWRSMDNGYREAPSNIKFGISRLSSVFSGTLVVSHGQRSLNYQIIIKGKCPMKGVAVQILLTVSHHSNATLCWLLSPNEFTIEPHLNKYIQLFHTGTNFGFPCQILPFLYQDQVRE